MIIIVNLIYCQTSVVIMFFPISEDLDFNSKEFKISVRILQVFRFSSGNNLFTENFIAVLAKTKRLHNI